MSTRALWHIKCSRPWALHTLGTRHFICHDSRVTSIAPIAMGNRRLYIARVLYITKSLYNHPLPMATGTIHQIGVAGELYANG